MVTIGDCIIDAAGAIGTVVDVGDDVTYKSFAFDGMEFVYHSPPSLVTQVGEKLKKAWLREVNSIRRKEDGKNKAW